MSEIKLKPCPFCGGEADTNLMFGRVGVTCTKCGANIRMEHAVIVDKAIEAWNRRDGAE